MCSRFGIILGNLKPRITFFEFFLEDEFKDKVCGLEEMKKVFEGMYKMFPRVYQ